MVRNSACVDSFGGFPENFRSKKEGCLLWKERPPWGALHPRHLQKGLLLPQEGNFMTLICQGCVGLTAEHFYQAPSKLRKSTAGKGGLRAAALGCLALGPFLTFIYWNSRKRTISISTSLYRLTRLGSRLFLRPISSKPSFLAWL